MKKIVLYCLACVFIFTSCSSKEERIIFKDELVISYSEDINFAELIETIDGEAFDPSLVQDNVLELENGDTLICNMENINVSLGTYRIIYKLGKFNKAIEVTIVDDIAPVINVESEYIVEVENTYFNLSNLITVTDNYDRNLDIHFNGSYDLETVGDYDIEMFAVDSSGNETRENTVVRVVEKEVIEIEIEVPSTQQNRPGTGTGTGNNGTGNGNGNGAGTGTGSGSQGTTPPPVNNYVPQDRTFLFSDYGDFDTTLAVCTAYINEAFANGYVGRGEAQVLQDANGVYIGYRAVFS